MNKLFKKVLSTVLAVAMLGAMSASVFAEETDKQGESAENIQSRILERCPNCSGQIRVESHYRVHDWVSGIKYDVKEITYECYSCSFKNIAHEYYECYNNMCKLGS